MAHNRWLGRAGAVAEVNILTVTGVWAAGKKITITINGKDLVITIGSLITTAQVATTIKEAWEGESFTDTTATVVPDGGGPDFTEHSEMTATVSGSAVTLTADTAGVPWNTNDGMNVTEDADGGITWTQNTADTVATGPNFADNVDNWSAGTLPTTAEDVWVDNSDVSIQYGLDKIADTLATLNIAASFTGDIGLPRTNASGYPEYRKDYWAIEATDINVGYGEGQGSGRIKLDSLAVQSDVAVESTGSSAEPGVSTFLWKGTHVDNTLRVMDGSVGVAEFNGEEANLASATIAGGEIYLSEGITWKAANTIDIETAEVTLRIDTAGVATVTNSGGTLAITTTAAVLFDAVIVATLNAKGGTTTIRGTGTITACNVGGLIEDVGLLDCRQDNALRTFTTLTLKRNGQFDDNVSNPATVTTLAKGSDVRSLAAL